MRPTKCQFITRIRNAQGRLEATIHRNRANTFLEQKDEEGLVRQRLAYNNLTRTLQNRQTIEYDGQGKIIHSVDTGDYWCEEMVSIHADGINVTHTLKHYNEIGKDDEYVIMADDGRNCVVATYSYTTGRLLNIRRIFSECDNYADIDFCEDGTILEWRKERLSE